MTRRTSADSPTPVELSTWGQLLQHYDTHHRHKRQDELDWFATQTTFRGAIRAVARAEGRRGERLDHQRRIRRGAVPEAEVALMKSASLLRRVASFAELLQAIEITLRPIFGIGELYCYDAALRLGCYLSLAPEYVYLHAGTRKGARAFATLRGKISLLPREAFPEELRNRSAGEIENILCVYENIFAKGLLPGALAVHAST